MGETLGLLPVRMIGATMTESERSTRRTPSGMIHIGLLEGRPGVLVESDPLKIRVAGGVRELFRLAPCPLRARWGLILVVRKGV
jgi:hypothetical protein